MKMQTTFLSNVVLAAALLACTGTASGQTPMGTAFTYQGILTVDGPPEPVYDFDFGLYDQPNDGNQLALSCSVPNVPVEQQTGVFTVKVDFSSDVFNGEARWLQVAVKRTSDHDYTTLRPRQELTPSPYALYAEDYDWEVSGSDVFTGHGGAYPSGNVGIGTTNPLAPLEVVGSPVGQWIRVCDNDSPWITMHEYRGRNELWIAAYDRRYGNLVYSKDPANGTSQGFGIAGGPHMAALERFVVTSDEMFVGYCRFPGTGEVCGGHATGDLYVRGKLGVGTTTPRAKLNLDVTSPGVPGALRIERNDPGAGYGDTIALMGISANYGPTGLRISMSNDDGASFKDTMFLTEGGDIGIRTTTPDATLDLNGNMIHRGFTLRHEGPDFVMAHGPRGDGGRALVHEGDGTDERLVLNYAGDFNRGTRVDGNLGIGTPAEADARLTVKAGEPGPDDDTATTVILRAYVGSDVVAEIGAGLDYSESFPTSGSETCPGTVMVIDPANNGHLTISSRAYDRKVAGIVAGANGLGSGVRLGSTAPGAGHHAVALAGRVYCNVDAQHGDIEVGDLLTTSPTPGHAMVVKDFSKAQGAVLGKAMGALSGGGRGQVLVLVALQ